MALGRSIFVSVSQTPHEQQTEEAGLEDLFKALSSSDGPEL